MFDAAAKLRGCTTIIRGRGAVSKGRRQQVAV